LAVETTGTVDETVVEVLIVLAAVVEADSEAVLFDSAAGWFELFATAETVNGFVLLVVLLVMTPELASKLLLLVALFVAALSNV
jgi:hypothetical protein